jgi:hypothetical protein
MVALTEFVHRGTCARRMYEVFSLKYTVLSANMP